MYNEKMDMMKTKIKNALSTLLLFSTLLVMGQDQYKADTESSLINWKGFKPTGEHYGTVKVKSGSFKIENKKIVAGEFEIDMNTIIDLDMAADSEYNAKLVGHLKSDDFFGVEKYPTATLTITAVEKGKGDVKNITADLTIKEVTKDIVFNAYVDGNTKTFSTTFKIDRTRWGVTYNNPLKNNAISDAIEFDVFLQFETEN